MDQDRFIPHQKVQMSKALWDFGSYPERKGDGLLFEKEVLDKQVGKGSKYFQLNCLKVQKISILRPSKKYV